MKHNLSNPGREAYEFLVISAPSYDISSTKTVNTSCQNLIKIAEDTLSSNNNLKKVIVMEHLPRFDNKLNSNLAKLANTTLSKLWEDSCFKDKIVIGKHLLIDYGVGKTHNSRYGNLETGKYDGIHLYGPSGAWEYTKNLNNILSSAIQRNDQNSHIHQNRYSTLSEGNF